MIKIKISNLIWIDLKNYANWGNKIGIFLKINKIVAVDLKL